MGRLQDRIAVVTGAGSGIGQASALRFAAEGATVVVTSRSERTAAETAQMIVTAGGRAISLAVDVGDAAQVQRMVETAQTEFGRIDVLFNNAMNVDFDRAARDVDFLELDPEIFMTSMRANVLGGVLAAKFALPGMLSRGQGSIIFNSSIASLGGDVSQFTYGAAKAAVNWYVQTIAATYGQRGIRCNGILPGVVKSPAQSAWMTPELDALYLDAASATRLGRPEDIAAVALFLASDEAAYVNGALWVVDGGTTCMPPFIPALRNRA